MKLFKTYFNIDDGFFAKNLDPFDGQHRDRGLLRIGTVVEQARQKRQQVSSMLKWKIGQVLMLFNANFSWRQLDLNPQT